MKPTICYYVHAHGSGHITSFLLMYPELSQHFTVIAVTTNKKATIALAHLSELQVIELPLKWPAESTPPPHTFSKAFEETPYSLEPAKRIAAMLSILETYQPVAFICDGSPELAIVVRGMGVPVVLGHLPGNVMADPTQVFAYELADCIVAYFPASLEAADYQYGDKTYYGGFMSRYTSHGISSESDSSITIVLGTDNYSESLLQTMTADPARSFTIIGNHVTYDLGENCRQLGRVTDVAAAINGYIVISAAGQNTIAELLSLRKRILVLPEPRPYDEQRYHAAALAEHGAALLANETLTSHEWSTLYDKAKDFDFKYDGLVNPQAPAELAVKLKERYATI